MARHKHADVIHAWAEGEEVEILDNGQWIDAKTPNFCTMYEYRIKPKTVKREAWVNIYTAEECFAYPTKEKADSWASDNRKACIRIEWEEEV